MTTDSQTLDWLMQGDPVIRWQAMRDLIDAPEAEWQEERIRTIDSGWGAAFAAAQLSDTTWPVGRWTGTLWTLLMIIECGIPVDGSPFLAAAEQFVARNLTQERANDETWLMKQMDLCHLGFWLRIGAYYLPGDERLVKLAGTVMRAQMADGGWNCRIRTYPKTKHSSFHTTFNILEGLRQAAEAGVIAGDLFRASEARALEFMLQHQMYRSDKTGEVIEERFTHLTFPSHWHYNVLRGLDYMRISPAIGDARLNDPMAMLAARRTASGRWIVEKRIAGSTSFDMEKFGGESRWNTLKALRILRRREMALAG